MGRGESDESQLRALVGAGRTSLAGDLALRAREVSRPSPADEAAAERSLVIKHGRPID